MIFNCTFKKKDLFIFHFVSQVVHLSSSPGSVVTVRTGQYEPSRLRSPDYSHSLPRHPPEPAGGADVLSASWSEGAGKLSGRIQSCHVHPCEPPVSPSSRNPLSPNEESLLPCHRSHTFSGGCWSIVSPDSLCHSPSPEKFSGESRKCCAFIVDCEMCCELLQSAFPTEQSKVAFIISPSHPESEGMDDG